MNLDFRLRVVERGATREVAFKDLLTRRTIVSVYMRNNTGSCDRQNDALAACAAELARAGFDLIALSRDTPGSHLRYAAKKKISHLLASDPHDLFARATDSIVEKTMYGRKFLGPSRSAFVLDPNGTVLHVLEKVDASNHGEQLLRLIAEKHTPSLRECPE